MAAGDGDEPLFLQAKEAQPSVLAEYCGRSQYANQGERVVAGQHLMQAAKRHLPGLDPRSRARRGGPRLLRAPAAGLEVLGADRADASRRHGGLRRGCADGRWPGRTPGPATGSRWPRTSAARTRSTRRSPISPRRTPTRTSATTPHCKTPCDRAAPRPSTASENRRGRFAATADRWTPRTSTRWRPRACATRNGTPPRCVRRAGRAC